MKTVTYCVVLRYLHEIGLAISHSGYHRHGAYLLQHSDIPVSHKLIKTISHIWSAHHRRKLRSDAQVRCDESRVATKFVILMFVASPRSFGQSQS